MKGTNRTNVAAYLAAQKHLKGDLSGAKTLTKMAAELRAGLGFLHRGLSGTSA